MNVYVMVDIEGISGIYTREQVLPSEGRFGEGRKYMTADVNACTAGLKAAGVDKIYVRDCHGGSYSLLWDDLSDDADYYVCGNMRSSRFAGIEECDAVILLGYHAMAGTFGGVLEHSWNSKRIQNIIINGVKRGEIAMDAAAATMYGKPVIMISGDDKACNEASEIIPEIVCAEVKKSVSTYGTMLVPPDKAHKMIYEKSIEAVKNASRCSMFSFGDTIDTMVELTERSDLPLECSHPYIEIIDGRTYMVKADNPEQLIYRISP